MMRLFRTSGVTSAGRLLSLLLVAVLLSGLCLSNVVRAGDDAEEATVQTQEAAAPVVVDEPEPAPES